MQQIAAGTIRYRRANTPNTRFARAADPARAKVHDANDRLPESFSSQFVKFARRQQLDDGTYVAMKGDVAHAFYIIESGRIKIRNLLPNGNEILFDYLTPGHWFGAMELIDGLPGQQELVADGPTVVHKISAAEFSAIVEKEPALYGYFVRHYCGLLRAMCERVEELAMMSVRLRIARRLQAFVDRRALSQYDNPIWLELTQSDIAQMVGATRKATGKVLRDWRDEGIINLQYGRVAVVDRRRFMDLQNAY